MVWTEVKYAPSVASMPFASPASSHQSQLKLAVGLDVRVQGLPGPLILPLVKHFLCVGALSFLLQPG